MLGANGWPCLPAGRARRPSQCQPARPPRIPPSRSPRRSPSTTRMTIHSPFRTAGLGDQAWCGERRQRLGQEIAGSDSDPNVARLTGSVEVPPLAGATAERGAAGSTRLLDGWAATAGNPAGAEAAVVRGANGDRRNLARLWGVIGAHNY